MFFFNGGIIKGNYNSCNNNRRRWVFIENIECIEILNWINFVDFVFFVSKKFCVSLFLCNVYGKIYSMHVEVWKDG